MLRSQRTRLFSAFGVTWPKQLDAPNVKPIRLLEEGVAPLKVKQVVLPSKMTSKRVKEMPPSTVKQLVLLLKTL